MVKRRYKVQSYFNEYEQNIIQHIARSTGFTPAELVRMATMQLILNIMNKDIVLYINNLQNEREKELINILSSTFNIPTVRG